jgi:hypothetical protein
MLAAHSHAGTAMMSQARVPSGMFPDAAPSGAGVAGNSSNPGLNDGLRNTAANSWATGSGPIPTKKPIALFVGGGFVALALLGGGGFAVSRMVGKTPVTEPVGVLSTGVLSSAPKDVPTQAPTMASAQPTTAATASAVPTEMSSALPAVTATAPATAVGGKVGWGKPPVASSKGGVQVNTAVAAVTVAAPQPKPTASGSKPVTRGE